MKLVEWHLLRTVKPKKPWGEHFADARQAASRMGGLYTASMYVNLVSLLSSASAPSLNRIALFSYGSCSASTLMHATIHHSRRHSLDLPEKIAERSLVSFETLKMVAVRNQEPQAVPCISVHYSSARYRAHSVSIMDMRQCFIDGWKVVELISCPNSQTAEYCNPGQKTLGIGFCS